MKKLAADGYYVHIGKTAEKLRPYLQGNPELLGAEVYQSVDKLTEDVRRLLG